MSWTSEGGNSYNSTLGPYRIQRIDGTDYLLVSSPGRPDDVVRIPLADLWGNPSAPVGSAASVTAAIAAAVSASFQWGMWQQQEASGDPGGSAAIGVVDLNINTAIYNSIAGATFAAPPAVSLPAGSYVCWAGFPLANNAAMVAAARLYNVTDASVAVQFPIVANDASASGNILFFRFFGAFTLAAAKSIKLQIESDTVVANAFGLASTLIGPEIYSDWGVVKVA